MMHKVIFYWFPLCAYMGIIFYMSHQSDPTPGVSIPVSDKLIHFGEYFVLQVLAIRAFCYSPVEKLDTKRIILSILFSCVFAMSDEYHQLFVPGRDCSFFDFLANAAGLCMGALFYLLIKHRHFLRRMKNGLL